MIEPELRGGHQGPNHLFAGRLGTILPAFEVLGQGLQFLLACRPAEDHLHGKVSPLAKARQLHHAIHEPARAVQEVALQLLVVGK